MYKIYIGFDSSNYGQQLAYDVCKKSILNHCSNPEKIEIIQLLKRDLERKKIFWRNQTDGVTEFTYTRFLAPYLNKYKGWALFCDSDFLWECDVIELIEKYKNNNYAICCVKHIYTNCNGKTKMNGLPQEWYPRKNWSSLMLFNCEHNSTKKLTLENVNTQSPAWLHRMNWALDNEIGEIPKDYNYLVDYYHDGNFKVLHYTDGGPWHPGYEDCQYGNKWLKYLEQEEIDKMLECINNYYKTGILN